MHNTIRLLLVGFILTLNSCRSSLLNPLDGSTLYPRNPSVGSGAVIYLKPGINLNVRAIEDCIILEVQKSDSFNINIVAKGKHWIGYGNITKLYVNKDDRCHKGQIIGVLSPKDSTADNDLRVTIKKGETIIIPNWAK